MHDLIRCGKVRYAGASNVTGWQMQKLVSVADKLGIPPVATLQVCKELSQHSTNTSELLTTKSSRQSAHSYEQLLWKNCSHCIETFWHTKLAILYTHITDHYGLQKKKMSDVSIIMAFKKEKKKEKKKE